MRPNILLVVLDAARRDALAPYRHGAPTPAIAQLARRGLAHPRAYATASWTLPSHASLFTGRLPRALGLGQAPQGSPESVRPLLRAIKPRLLPSVLADAGYRTSAFSGNLWVSAHSGFDVGFERFVYRPSQRAETVLGSGRRAALAWVREGAAARRDDGAAELGRALRQEISAWSGRPSFWFVNLIECHSPYMPPRPWNDLGPIERVRAGLDARRWLSFQSICRAGAGALTVPIASLERMRHLYQRSIAYLDSWLAGVLEALDHRGILEQTLVIVTADHGESFGERGLLAHGFALGEWLIHVPLVIAGPGAPSDSGTGAFSLAGLARLLAEAAGVREHPFSESWPPDGIALAQHDPMAGPSDPKVRAFVDRWGIDEEGVQRLTASMASATDGRFKLLRGSDEEERLYDLGADPDERSPLASSDAGDVRDKLAAALDRAAFASSAAAVSGAPPPVRDAEELAKIERQMKLLGYL
jgi:arylsulfatase A-like enzyme